jgi:hypothetical protein
MMDSHYLTTVAEQLGHTNLVVEPATTGQRWRATCACGYGTTVDGGLRSHATQAVAAESLIWHLTKTVTEHLAKTRQMGIVSSSQGSAVKGPSVNHARS